MIARLSETLEEYVEQFQNNLQWSPYETLPLPDNVLKTTLIKGMKEQWIETMNIMGKGHIYQEECANSIKLYIRSSRGSMRLKLEECDMTTRDNKISGGSITRA